MTVATLPHDALWPRAGDWPAAESLAADQAIDLALIGIPAWRTSLSATRAGETPSAIRAALRKYSPALMPDRGGRPAPRTLDELVLADFGDVTDPDSPAGERRAIAAVAAASARSRVVVALGGDNSLTVAAALGSWGVHVQTAGLITLDAHYDLRDGVSNGSPVRRLVEAGLDGRRIVQIGIADFVNSRDYAQRALDFGITVVHRDELHRRPMTDVVAEALEIAGAAGGPIHVDLDVDVCDRSVAPGCPASVPGGISAFELRTAARAAGADPRVVSVDLAEIDATADAADGRTVRLAALCVLEVAAGLLDRP
ncbi:arginase family protein [Glaciibacter psychrotolerans]|uniref:Formiminoglutamase n=1 Tax=Glaciibacter psychrotolerans TaxID=670054 RepID=A0A7Z0EI98_9MICO|nr:arginase family protein [Leifsonia psychrotolerans]NYJ21362.1 formiminoglutamase [Leifsonia psychrotolerans]